MAGHDQIMTLDQSRMNWNVIVRITAIWPSISVDGVVIRQNLILLDSENTRIHAISTPEIWNEFQHLVMEGTICNIRNFSVVPATGIFRPVRHPFSINFVPQTTITVSETQHAFFPLHKFDIKNLGDLPEKLINRNEFPQNQYATDVIGIVEDIQPIQIVPSNRGEVKSIRFRINDGRVAMRVRLTGLMDNVIAPFYENAEANPMIVILAGTKIDMFRGYPIVYSHLGTKIYINLDCPEVIEMRQRLINEGFQGFLPGV